MFYIIYFFRCVVGFLTRLDRGAGNFYIMMIDPKLIAEINNKYDDNLKARKPYVRLCCLKNKSVMSIHE